MNLSASLNVFKLLRYPGLCIPHATVSTFNDLPIPLSKAFGEFRPDIRAVILDKDNCFARPKQNSIYVPYKVCHWFQPAYEFSVWELCWFVNHELSFSFF